MACLTLPLEGLPLHPCLGQAVGIHMDLVDSYVRPIVFIHFCLNHLLYEIFSKQRLACHDIIFFLVVKVFSVTTRHMN